MAVGVDVARGVAAPVGVAIAPALAVAAAVTVGVAADMVVSTSVGDGCGHSCGRGQRTIIRHGRDSGSGAGGWHRRAEESRQDGNSAALTMREGRQMRSERGSEPFPQVSVQGVVGARRCSGHQWVGLERWAMIIVLGLRVATQQASHQLSTRRPFGRRKLVTMPIFLRQKLLAMPKFLAHARDSRAGSQKSAET